jgi:hypothetical protein
MNNEPTYSEYSSFRDLNNGHMRLVRHRQSATIITEFIVALKQPQERFWPIDFISIRLFLGKGGTP